MSMCTLNNNSKGLFPRDRSQGRVFLTAVLMLWMPMALLAAANPAEILLWPGGAPGAEGKTGDEKVRIADPTGDHVVTEVHKPSITPYLPVCEKATGRGGCVAL